MNKDILKDNAISIDEFAVKNKLENLDFIKMNIEGSELEAIKGVKKTVEKFKPSFVISTDHVVNDELTYIKIEKFFKNLNYYKLKQYSTAMVILSHMLHQFRF